MHSLKLVEELKSLASALGVAGFEREISALISSKLSELGLNVREDSIGNVYATVEGEGKKVVLAAHMDEVGLMVSKIEDNGFLRFQTVGGIDERALPGTPVVVHSSGGKFRGVIPFPAPHVLQLAGRETKEVIPAGQLWIDIGASSASEVEEMGIRCGDPVTFATWPFSLGGSRIASKSLDDRLGCLALLKVAERLASEGSRNIVTLVFTVQEEMGLVGAHAAEEKADLFVAVDSASIADHPEVPSWVGTARLGEGPVLRVLDRRFSATEKVRRGIEEIAKKIGVNVQVMLAGGTTDASAFHAKGVASVPLCFPLRYTHSPCEVADARDFEALVTLLTEVARSWA